MQQLTSGEMKDAMEKMYEEAGIEYSKGLERFMGNDALYQKFLALH